MVLVAFSTWLSGTPGGTSVKLTWLSSWFAHPPPGTVYVSWGWNSLVLYVPAFRHAPAPGFGQTGAGAAPADVDELPTGGMLVAASEAPPPHTTAPNSDTIKNAPHTSSSGRFTMSPFCIREPRWPTTRHLARRSCQGVANASSNAEQQSAVFRKRPQRLPDCEQVFGQLRCIVL